MKIVHIIDSLNPAHGGPSVSAPSLAAAQSYLGHDISLLYQQDERNFGDLVRENNYVPNFKTVKLIRISKNGIFDELFGQKIDKKLCDNIRQCDIVHMHGVWDPILYRAAKLSVKFETGFVLAPRGMLHPWSLSQKRLKKKLMLDLFLKRILNKSAFIHALNATEAHFVGSLGLKCPIRIFPNGVFPEQYKSPADSEGFFRKFPELNRRPFILFLGRLHYKKGMDYVADAFAEFAREINGVDLIVAGPDEGERAGFEDRVKYHQLSSRVHLVGPLYGDLKYAALQEAICFLLPSRQEGFSVAIIEAIASGLPVVISEECNFPEIVEYGAGEVVPLNANAIKSALHRIVSNPQLRAQMGRSARDLVLSKFSWYSIAKAVIAGYVEVLN
jgi:glycosyltransferase involved in cell wall biosynthesis